MTSKRHWVIIQHWHCFLWIPRSRKPYKLRRNHCSNTNISRDVIDVKHGVFFEIHIVFDTSMSDSLKATERARRQKGTEPVRYRILGNYHTKVPTLKKLLSHTENKDELTVLFSEALIVAGKQASKNVTVSFRCDALSTFMSDDVTDGLRSTHEEADIKLILHAVHAADRGAKRIRIFSSDTDVLVLAIRRQPMLPENTAFVTIRSKRREIFLKPIFDALGAKRAAALPAFHGLSGADVTGSFSGKGQTSLWKKFLDASDNILLAFISIGETENISDTTPVEIEKIICAVYRPTNCSIAIDNLSDLRWWFYSKKQVHGTSMHASYDCITTSSNCAITLSMHGVESRYTTSSLTTNNFKLWLVQ